MTDAAAPVAVPSAPRKGSLLTQDDRTKKRNAAEARFKMYGLIAVMLGLLALVILVTSILINGSSAFQQTFVTLEVELDEARLDKTGNRNREEMAKVSTFGYAPLIAAAVGTKMEEFGIEIEGLSTKDAGAINSKEAPAQLRDFVLANPETVGTTVAFKFLANGRIDGYMKGRVTRTTAERDSNV
ncbi:MAG: DUF3333 domain-containing protein, partial [Alphaproteobacteria bacterium]|nr:DUF3333 domain-containing protein [Alphaproteobacteria bacterium]